MKILAICFTALLLCACGDQPNRELKAYRAEMRVKLFQECMAVLPLIQRTADDDVSDAIDSCDRAAAYQSMSLGEQK